MQKHFVEETFIFGLSYTTIPAKDRGSKSYSRPRWSLRIAATHFALNLAFSKMAQLQCSDIKMGCSDTVLFRAHRKKFRGNTAQHAEPS